MWRRLEWIKTSKGYQLTARASLAAKIKAERALAKKIADEKAGSAMHPLAADPRLHVKLRVVETNPPLPILLTRLSTATGLKFTLASELADHDPNYGTVHLNEVEAWSVMEMIVEQHLQDGRWTKTTQGYQLSGTSTAPRPQPAPMDTLWTAGRIATLAFLVSAALVYAVVSFRALRQKPVRI